MESCLQVQLWCADRNKSPQLILGSCVLMALSRSLLGQEFEENWWSYLCLQVFRHSWEIISFLAVFVYVVLWPTISSGHRGEIRRLLFQAATGLLCPMCSCLGSSEPEQW